MQGTYADQYRDLWTRHWWWRARERFVLRWIKGIARQHPLRQILDIGCGDGLFFNELSAFGEVHGIEPDERLLSPQGRWRSRIENVSFGPAYSTEQHFDLITMLDVIEHIEDDVGALRRAHSLLNADGFLLLTVPALPMLWSAHDDANCHFRRYTRSSMKRSLAAAGFELLRCRYFFGWTMFPMVLRRLMHPGARAGKNTAEYAVTIPPAPINGALYWLTIAEQLSTAYSGSPLGSSIIVLARPNRAAGNGNH